MPIDADNVFTEIKTRGQRPLKIPTHNQNKPKTVRLLSLLIMSRIAFFNSQLFQITPFCQQKPVIHNLMIQEL